MSERYEYDYDQYDCVIRLTGDVNYELQKELLPYNSIAMEGVVAIFDKDDDGYRWGIEVDYSKYKPGELDSILNKHGYIQHDD